ncbi:homeobox protein pknox1 [Acrodontium crateriforme]|uniref:Homeobox protein pknox1 n=1 Tax=Acrodontium crateriforme TaxID=150365 RepID=A0AAQ3M1L5_9PEZI|nr:homeobox protein pknox1 [Acrodontium crateriforme]
MQPDFTSANELDVDFDLSHATFNQLPAAADLPFAKLNDAQSVAVSDWNLANLSSHPFGAVDEPDYSKPEDWIPRFTRPERPCDYCQSKRLECHLARGEASCTSCRSLFRECSLYTAHGRDGGTGSYKDESRARGHHTASHRPSNVHSNSQKLKGESPSDSPAFIDDAPGSSKRNGIRFPRHAVKLLREWLDAHPDHPYPTEAEKAELERRTELRPTQIANWLANARRRRKVTDRSRPKSCYSPSLRPSTPAMPIPSIRAGKSWDELNPFERWQNSPPENEPAAMGDIAKAVAHIDAPKDDSLSPSSSGREKLHSTSTGYTHYHKAASVTSVSQTSARSSDHSGSSAAFSQNSSNSQGSFGSFSSSLAGKKDRRRRRRPVQAIVRRASDDKRRIFQCTFCTDAFKSKYDWTRHEKSLHLSLEKWICAPCGPVNLTADGIQICVYCNFENPDEAHLEAHNHKQCEEKGLDARTFYRKDHLRQHLRLMHGCAMTDDMDHWKTVATNINSRCGFCAQRFTVWQERIDHLTAHFKAGTRMGEWKGCRGLDPAVAAQVTNAMPPYLIGIESVSPIPFSATNRGTWRQGPIHHSGLAAVEEQQGSTSKATCWELLTVRLGKYAHQAAREGLVLTDEMLQMQARRLMYESDDAWNQTAADNPEWLDLFKKAHGLGFAPTEIGGQGREVPEDLETYGDLGLRIPFAVQLEAYNKMHDDTAAAESPSDTSPYRVALENRRREFHDAYASLTEDGLIHDQDYACGHPECKNNIIDLSAIEPRNAPGPRNKRWCARQMPPSKAQQLSAVTNHLLNQRMSVLEANTPSDTMDEWQATLDENDMDRSHATIRQLSTPISPTSNPSSNPSHFRHHQYEMSSNGAHVFATTTPAWEDSGKMPSSIATQVNTSTGAMMGFLGSELVNTMPFSTHAAASSNPLENATSGTQHWDFSSMAGMDETDLINDLEAYMASTGAPQVENSGPILTQTSDFMMDDMSFNEMNFDGVFDIPMDGRFDGLRHGGDSA